MKNFFTKAMVAIGVMASAMALSSVCIWAYDYEYTIATPGTKTVDNYTLNNTTICSVNHNKGSANDGAKFDGASSKDVSASFVTSPGTPYYIGIVAEAGDTVTLQGTITDSDWKVINVDNVTSGTISEATAYASLSNGSVKLNDAGTYKIYNVTNSSKYVKGVKSVSGTQSTKYTVSGTVVNEDDYTGTLKIGDKSVDYSNGNYSLELTDGTYNLTLNNALYTVDPASIIVNGANVTKNITIEKASVTTISGDLDANLGITDTIKFINGTNSYTATIEGSSYSVIVPQNQTYTISVLDDTGYKTSAYAIDQTSVTTTTSTTLDCDLTGTKITSWKTSDVGTKMPDVTIQKATGTYKGISVDATATYKIGNDNRNAKWASKNGQVNSKTILTVPLDPTTQALSLKVTDSNSVGYEVTYTESAGIITVNDYNSDNSAYSIYITEISIVNAFTKDATNHKAIYKDSSNNAYLVVGVSADDVADTTATAVNILNSSNEIKKSSTKVYKSVSVTDGTDTITLNASDIDSAYLFGVKIKNASGYTLSSFSGSVTKS